MINQPSRNQFGFTIVEVVVTVVVIAILASAGYLYLAKRTGDANPLGAIQKTSTGLSLNPNCEYKDPDLCKFLNNFKDQKSYSISADSTDKDNVVSNVTMDIDGENYHLQMSQKGKVSYNVIVIGNTTYTLDTSDSKWWKQDAPESASNSASLKSDFSFKMPTNSPNAKPEDRTTFEKQGKEACGNVTCFKYRANEGGQVSTIWFDDSQYQLRKIEMTDADGNKSTIEYRYDNAKVTAPSPVKTAAPDQVIMPSMPGMATPTISQQDMQDLQRISNDVQMQMPSDGSTGQ